MRKSKGISIGHPEKHFEAKLYVEQKERTIFYLKNPLHKRRLEILASLVRKLVVNDKRKYTLINIGSGEGELEEKVKHLDNLEKVAIDVSKEALEVGISKKRFDKIIVADIEEDVDKLDLKESADMLIAAEVLEHMHHPGVFIKEKLIPILKPEGHFLGSVPNVAQFYDLLGLVSGFGESYQISRPLTDVTSGHISFFSIHNLRDMLRYAGFRNVRIYGNGVRLCRNGDANLYWLSKLPFFKNFSDRFVFICDKV